MRPSTSSRTRLPLCAAAVLLAVCACGADPVATVPDDGDALPAGITGSVAEVDGLTVLKLWGTGYEMGRAQGYLLGETFVTMIDAYLQDPAVGFDAAAWETGLGFLGLFDYPAEYAAEMEGFLAGLEERHGGEVVLAALGRALRLDDIRGLQSDLDKMQCSSFAAWGDMTADGGTITGRNMDYDRIASFMAGQVIVVRIPPADSGRLPWVAITWPGDLGCTTGMNAQGVTVSQQDVYRFPPTAAGGHTPDNFLHRLLVETCRADSVRRDVEAVLGERHVPTGCAPMISWPHVDGPAALVPEFDGHVDLTGGFTIRVPEPDEQFLATANHFRDRVAPMQDCWRYNLLQARLTAIAATDGADHLTTVTAWGLLAETPIAETVAMHSVVFEPNLLRMTVAFTDGTRHAPLCHKVVLDIADLVALPAE